MLSVFGEDYYKGKFLEKKYIKKNHIIFSMLLQNISLILAGVLEFISFIRLNEGGNIIETKKKDTYLIYDYEQKLKSSKVIYVLLFITAVIDNIFHMFALPISLYENFFEININNVSLVLRYVQLIATALLCYFIIGFKFHKHQFLGLICVLIGTTLEYVFVLRTKVFLRYREIILIIVYIVFSLGQIIEKIIIESKFISPFKLLFVKGIFCTILNIILYVILNFIKCENNFLRNYYCTSVYIESGIKEIYNDITSFFVIIAFILITLVLNILAILTNFYFNPNYRVISDSFTDVIGYAYLYFVFKRNTYKIYNIFGQIILILGILIFNEIIILNIFGFSKYTKYEIDKRSTIDKLFGEKTDEEE
jgi:hypothetical protein